MGFTQKILAISACTFAVLVVVGIIVLAIVFAGLPKDVTVVTNLNICSLVNSNLTLDLSKVSGLYAVWNSVETKDNAKNSI